jgi:DNA-binding CsgD family transcriptional regulator
LKSRFESTEWLAALSRLVGSNDVDSAAAALADAIDVAVEHEGTCLLVFHRDAPPEVIHHTLEPAGRRHYVDRYVAGPYLLDPLYLLALGEHNPGVCRFRDESPDRFRSSEYYRQYCERTHLRDEMDFLVDVSENSTLVLVVGRRTRRFSKAELERLRRVESLVHAAMQSIWRQSSASTRPQEPGGSLHQRLTRCFENFGEGLLTERERQITQLLLRGHSTKSVARELGIAPGTVMVHKRNLFAKLGITSQYELFSLFIDAL